MNFIIHCSRYGNIFCQNIDHDSDMKRTMKVYETYQKIRSCNYTIGTLLYNMISVENVNGNMVAEQRLIC